MLLSMTGYGKSTGDYEGKSYTIDVKTLNGKMSDLRLKAPAFLRSKEITLRKIIMDKVVRGKMDCTINVLGEEADADYRLNIPLIETYLDQLQKLVQKKGLSNQDLLQTIIRIPNVVLATDEEVSRDEWVFICKLVDEAIDDLNLFRKQEGLIMLEDISIRVKNIISLLEATTKHESDRHSELLNRLRKSIEDNSMADKIDENRLEQEIIYYLEKLDIHEEKVRLKQHCDFFLETAHSEEINTGKKLNFISQEMGREINTLGSKAQYSPLQQIVVRMKVELDQIKEQLANVL